MFKWFFSLFQHKNNERTGVYQIIKRNYMTTIGNIKNKYYIKYETNNGWYTVKDDGDILYFSEEYEAERYITNLSKLQDEEEDVIITTINTGKKRETLWLNIK